METLTKRQKQILTCLKDAYPNDLASEILLKKIKVKPEDILSDVMVLEEKELITLIRGLGTHFPTFLKITPKGIAELRENFGTRLYDSIHLHPLTTITIVVAILSLVSNVLIFSENFDLQKQNIALQKQNLDLQSQIKQENELKQTMPPTAWLTQNFKGGDNEWYGRLEINPTLYFRKNSEKHFTIVDYQANFTLNGKDIGSEPVGGYPMKYITEELPYDVPIKSSIYPTAINPINMSKVNKDDLVINYILEIKDMDSQIRYRGNVTTEISSVYPPKSFPSGREPLIFYWTKV
jgi:hypothetical protein